MEKRLMAEERCCCRHALMCARKEAVVRRERAYPTTRMCESSPPDCRTESEREGERQREREGERGRETEGERGRET